MAAAPTKSIALLSDKNLALVFCVETMSAASLFARRAFCLNRGMVDIESIGKHRSNLAGERINFSAGQNSHPPLR